MESLASDIIEFENVAVVSFIDRKIHIILRIMTQKSPLSESYSYQCRLMHNHESLKRQGKLLAAKIRDVTIVFFFYPFIILLSITASTGFHCYFVICTFVHCFVYHTSLQFSHTEIV